MKPFKKILTLILLVLVILLIAHLFIGGVRVLRLSDSKVIDLDQMISEVKGARVIFVGEEHDRQQSHQAELEIIRKLHQSGVAFAIGLEMFTAKSQEKLDQWVAGKLDLQDFIRLYYHDWRMPWPYYRDILLYARKCHIPLIGLNIPEEISSKVAREGFAALTPAEREQLPQGITCSIDPGYRTYIRKAYAEHPHSGLAFTHFCEAQMLWNRSMGHYLREYLTQAPKSSAIVLAGIGHAMKRGIPEESFGNTDYSYKVILPKFPDVDRSVASSGNADYMLLFPRLTYLFKSSPAQYMNSASAWSRFAACGNILSIGP